MNRIRLFTPERHPGAVRFRWEVSPHSALYRSSSFVLRFPESLPLERVSDRVWWTAAMLCLHTHWLLLRPCVVEFPIDLGEEEVEFWRRLLEIEAATLDSLRPKGSLADATLDIRVSGPSLPREPWPIDRDAPVRCATAFSGGKDSLLQAAILAELTERPVLVTTTSPLPPLADHRTARRRSILKEAPARLGASLFEVETGFRSCWDNSFAEKSGYRIGVNEITDTFLYLASTLAVGAATGARHLFLASEGEVQETVERDGRTIQHPHFMYSAATQNALAALLARSGFRCGSLTAPLWSEQVQRLLWIRYRHLSDLQYSCWRVGETETACSRCGQCLRVALTALSSGGNPEEMGIDLAVLFAALETWRPSSDERADSLPGERVALGLHEQVVRCAREVRPARVWKTLAGRRPRAAFERRTYTAVASFRRFRSGLSSFAASPPGGYRPAFLSWVDPLVRDGVARIYSEAFPADDSAAARKAAERSRRLSEWFAKPLEGLA